MIGFAPAFDVVNIGEENVMKSAAVGVILVTFACVSSASAACDPSDFNRKVDDAMARADGVMKMKFDGLDKGARNDTATSLSTAAGRAKDAWDKCVQDKDFQKLPLSQYPRLLATFRRKISGF